jgi:hypothetical protein
MVDHYTHFSCTLDVGTGDNAARALDLYQGLRSQLEIHQQSADFKLQLYDNPGTPSLLWIYEETYGNTDQVVAFVSELGPMLGLTGLWGFEWAHTCSRPCAEAFGGGALVMDLATGEVVATISTREWLTRFIADPHPAGRA